jgi:shikimate kinase
MAAGKSTLARKVATDANAMLIDEDLWLSKLVGDQFGDYLK